MAYFGCRTAPNRVRWLLSVMLAAVASLFVAIYHIEGGNCKECTTDPESFERTCEDIEGTGDGVHFENIEGCNIGVVVASFIFFIVLYVLALVPCCLMICVPVPPKVTDGYSSRDFSLAASRMPLAPTTSSEAVTPASRSLPDRPFPATPGSATAETEVPAHKALP